MGVAEAKNKNYTEALEHLEKSVESAKGFGDNKSVAQANTMIANVYQAQGGEAFNNKDYAAAAGVFAKGYEANPNNTKLANFLAMSYCEMGDLDKGVEIYGKVVEMGSNPRYAADATEARTKMGYYYQLEVAKLQQAKDNAGVIALTEKWQEMDAEDALANKVLMQAYAADKKFDKVIAMGEKTATLQVDETEKSNVYFTLGAAYVSKEQKTQAIAAFRNVTAGPNVAKAKQTIAELNK